MGILVEGFSYMSLLYFIPSVRFIPYTTCPLNPSSMQSSAAANKGAAATSYIRGIQTVLAREFAMGITYGEGVYTSYSTCMVYKSPEKKP